MKDYKIIRKNQFACSIMQVRRDKKMPVAILKDYDEAIISQAYPVFRVVDETKLLPDYLMMWMSREEFDREACFLAVGGVRGSLEWEDFLDMELPVPSIDKQREIVAEYNAVVDRIELNEQINQKLEETAKAIYRQWFVEFEFPISKEYAKSIGKPELEGQPYKSSGGEMVYNEELNEEIPKNWGQKPFTKIVNLKSGGTPQTSIPDFWDGTIPFYTPGDLGSQYFVLKTNKSITDLGLKKCSSKMFPKYTTFLTARGATTGRVGLTAVPMAMNQTCYAMCAVAENYFFTHQFVLHIIKELKREAIGATFQALVTKDFEMKKCLKPNESLTTIFDYKISAIYKLMENKVLEIDKLNEFKSLLLSRMTLVAAEMETSIL